MHRSASTLLGAASLLGAVALSACSARPAAAPTHDASSDAQQIRAALADWEAAYNAGDDARAFTVWAPDLVGWYPGSAPVTWESEHQRLAAPHDPSAPARAPLHVRIEEILVSGDLAVVRDVWTEGVATADHKASELRSFEVWRRQADGHWKIARWISAPQP